MAEVQKVKHSFRYGCDDFTVLDLRHVSFPVIQLVDYLQILMLHEQRYSTNNVKGENELSRLCHGLRLSWETWQRKPQRTRSLAYSTEFQILLPQIVLGNTIRYFILVYALTLSVLMMCSKDVLHSDNNIECNGFSIVGCSSGRVLLIPYKNDNFLLGIDWLNKVVTMNRWFSIEVWAEDSFAWISWRIVINIVIASFK